MEKLCEKCGGKLQCWSDEITTSKLYGAWEKNTFVVEDFKVYAANNTSYSFFCVDCYSPAEITGGFDVRWE